MAAKMNVSKYYWSRSPGEFVNRDTGEVIVNPPKFPGETWMWCHTLVAEIFELSLPEQDIVLAGRDVRVVFESSPSYSCYLPEHDALPLHENFPADPANFEFSGWLSNGTNKKEVWLAKDYEGLKRKVSIFDLRSMDRVQINILKLGPFD